MTNPPNFKKRSEGGWVGGFVTTSMDGLQMVVLFCQKVGLEFLSKGWLEYGLGFEFLSKSGVRIRPPGGLVLQSLHKTEQKCRLKSTEGPL